MFLVVSLRSGVCTRAGACRVHSQDFMYQGGCGEVTGWVQHHHGLQTWWSLVVRWGQMAIPDSPPCSMLVTSIEKLEGFCTRSGHCWAAFKTKLLHPDCRSYITLVQGWRDRRKIWILVLSLSSWLQNNFSGVTGMMHLRSGVNKFMFQLINFCNNFMVFYTAINEGII